MNIEFIEKNQKWEEETTEYWFNVDGEQWAVLDCNGRLTLVDCLGYHVDQFDTQYEEMLEALTPHYESHIND